MFKLISLIIAIFTIITNQIYSQVCVECHKNNTPNIVKDWTISKHSSQGVGCEVCHGDGHKSAADVEKVQLPTPEVCANCHDKQVTQFKAGKHALSWVVMNAMPTIHYQPMAMREGLKGCGGCHKIGIKTADDIKKLKQEGISHGVASCDACHTRHTFSKEEAKQPQACQTCHMGFDHPQWEMYSSSKHGVRYILKQNGLINEDAQAPTCQTFHMQEGDHEVRTAWGFLALRLPLPEDKQWADDRVLILQALNVLSPEGQPTERLDAVKAADIVRLTQESFDKERNKMISVCGQCHSESFAKEQLLLGDQMIKEADHLMAEAIRVVVGLYKDGYLKKPDNYQYAFPDLLTFHDAPTTIEQKFFVMFLEHRMRAFQGTFHASPDYAMWYGWSEMQRDLTEIKEMAEQIKLNSKK